MSIPFWRYQDYTDDGCSIYECLNCYNSWEARTSPKHSEWKFCPCCGCEWDGEKEWDANAKWDRKKGVPLDKEDVRLCLPLFVAESRSVFLDGSCEPSEWKMISYGSEDYYSVIFTLEFHSSQEVDSDFFFATEEYRIRFEPYKRKYSTGRNMPETLTWRSVDIDKSAINKFRKHKGNVRLIEERRRAV
jgi:hypothetical protein